MTLLPAPSSIPVHTPCLPSGEHVVVRAAAPGDADRLQTYVRKLSASARYNRFFGALSELPAAELRRATHINGLSRATLIAEIGGSEAIMIGDGIPTDLAAARAVGARCILMLTGVATRTEVDALPADQRPTAVAADAAELAEILAGLS